jgi:ABC-type uncharacterized transport system YnjBCD ATPase subunit
MTTSPPNANGGATTPPAARLDVALVKQLPGFTLRVRWTAGDGVAVLFGPSGAGKSLTLACLAGLVRPDEGRIVVDGRVLFDAAAGIDLPPQRRRVGFVFQGYALFPHLSVADNVGFGLRDRPRAERERRVTEMLQRLGLAALATRRPHELSGGQRQRVALGRALASPSCAWPRWSSRTTSRKRTGLAIASSCTRTAASCRRRRAPSCSGNPRRRRSRAS